MARYSTALVAQRAHCDAGTGTGTGTTDHDDYGRSSRAGHTFTVTAAASHALVGLVEARELTVSFLIWVTLYVAAGVLLEQPGAPAWQQELALGVGVFALLMALLSIIQSAFGDVRE